MTRAVEQFREAYALAPAAAPLALPQVEEMLGTALLHKAGMDSGIFRKPDEIGRAHV